MISNDGLKLEECTKKLDEYLRALLAIASHTTTEEGDVQETENMFGIDASEVVEMAHDNMIMMAREALGGYGTHG